MNSNPANYRCQEGRGAGVFRQHSSEGHLRAVRTSPRHRGGGHRDVQVAVPSGGIQFHGAVFVARMTDGFVALVSHFPDQRAFFKGSLKILKEAL